MNKIALFGAAGAIGQSTAKAGALWSTLEGCAVDPSWPHARAEQWWQTHLPDVADGTPFGSPAGPTEV